MRTIPAHEAAGTASSQSTLDLHISDPASLLNEVAKRYSSTERILMEYVDNGLDDAEILYRANADAYPSEVRIEISIDTARRYVTILDNCRGMRRDTLERVVAKVGESQKKGITWVNGRFGFGVHAFRAAAETIHFRTKHADGEDIELSLQRNQHRGIRRPWRSLDPSPFADGTGTEVKVGPFEEEWFENVTAYSIKQEVECHFERLLARRNLSISVSQDGRPPVRCEPFDYSQIPGEDFERTLYVEFSGAIYPVEVHLKVSELEVPGRAARFFARGRRINEISEIKSFIRRSNHRTSVWGHPHLLGYIEVGELVRPVITRDDFDRGKRRTLLYDEVLDLEDDLKEALNRVNEAHRDTTLNRLEDVLRDVLRDLAREDRLLLRSELTVGNETGALITGGGGVNSEGEPEPKPTETGVTWCGVEAGEVGSDESEDGKEIGDAEGGHQVVDDPTQSEGARRRRAGFDIKFGNFPPDTEGQLRRSKLVDGTIYINSAHADFKERMAFTRQGGPKFTDRLGAYLAATVSIHYKDQFYQRYGRQPERRDQMFDEQVEFMCRLEAGLRPHLPVLQQEFGGDNGEEGGYD